MSHLSETLEHHTFDSKLIKMHKNLLRLPKEGALLPHGPQLVVLTVALEREEALAVVDAAVGNVNTPSGGARGERVEVADLGELPVLVRL